MDIEERWALWDWAAEEMNKPSDGVLYIWDEEQAL